MSYRTLDRRASALAASLYAAGLDAESLVAVLAEPSPDLVAALLGVLQAGMAFVPLDPGLPDDRLRLILARAGCRLVLAQADLRDRVPRGAGTVVPLDLAFAGAGRPPRLRVDPAGLCYVIHTSGSTGEPKGVMIEHRGLANLAGALRELARIGPGSRVLQHSSLGFDAAVWEILLTLAEGGTVCLSPRAAMLPGADLAGTLRTRRITGVLLPPSALAVTPPADLPDLTTVISGGERCTPPLVESWGRDRRFLNAYGPTEATVAVAAGECRRGDEPVTVGRPLRGVRLMVLDRDLRPVPDGEAGELHAAGVCLARGYLGRPDLTAERFVPDPLALLPGERMYRTGDLARRRPDGRLEILGRTDRQVKLRGFRVEPGDVEACLRRHPDVRDVAVTVRRDRPDVPKLVAYVALAGRHDPQDLAALVAFARRRLPHYMVPSAIVPLDRLPLNAGGKVDVAALPRPALLSGGGRPAATPTEEAVCSAWEEVLGRFGVRSEHDFLEVGGHSLDAVRIAARLGDRFGVPVGPGDLLTDRSVTAMAARIDRALVAGGDGAAPPRPSRADPAPGAPALSFAQEQLWFLDRLAPGGAAYNVSLAFRLRGRLDVDALEAALADLGRRHETLRARLPTRGGVPDVRVDGAGIAVERLAVAGGPGGREAAAAGVVEAAAARPFDLERGPLARSVVAGLGVDDHVLALTIHHVAADGWSLQVLCRELTALYRARVAGVPARLPEAPLQYSAHAREQRRRLDQERLAGLVERWRRRLAGAPPYLDLPARRRSPGPARHRGGRASLEIEPALARAVEQLGRQAGATVFMTLLAAFAVLLQRLTGQDDVVVGTHLAGRERDELEDVVGLFVNTLPLRTDLAGDPSFRDLVQRVRAAVLDAFADRELPFRLLVEGLHGPRDAGRGPVVQVVLNMYTFPEPALALQGVDAELLAEPTPGAAYELTLYARERNGRLRFDAVYDADLFEPAQMEELLRQYVGLLEQAAAAPERRLSDLSLVTAAARLVLPDPRLPLAAAAQPSLRERLCGRLAVSGDGIRLAPADVDEAAGRLATSLRDMGVGRGDLVAVRAGRGPWLPVALVGILRAGAAFCVLDAGHPPERLDACVRLSRPLALVEAIPDLPARRLPGERSPAVEPGFAYVAFTSGSTGAPQAIAGSEAPLAHFLAWYESSFGLGPGDRFALLAGVAHDPLLRDVLMPLWVGAELHVPGPDVHGAPASLLRWLRDREITVVHVTPALARLLIEVGGQPLPSLRLVASGGDLLLRIDVEGLAALAPHARFVNFYGTTETPQGVSALEVPRTSRGEEPGAPVPLGGGIADTQLLVLRGDRLAGVGELGEICVRTPFLAMGYVGEPDLTRRRFVRNPYRDDASDRVYRTGDAGRYHPDGTVAFCGRLDRQIKVSGVRVEPAEVEAALRGQAGVRAAAVVGRARAGRPELVGYVAAREGSIDLRQLRTRLRERLPEHMVPALLVRVDRLPLNRNGKLDERALPAPPAAAPAAAGDGPLGRSQRAVAAAWRVVLAAPAVGPDDNFFDLGGSSLAMARVHSLLQARLGRELSIVDLFRYPTVRTLAGFLDRRSTHEAAGDDAAVRGRDRLARRAARARPGGVDPGGRT